MSWLVLTIFGVGLAATAGGLAWAARGKVAIEIARKRPLAARMTGATAWSVDEMRRAFDWYSTCVRPLAPDAKRFDALLSSIFVDQRVTRWRGKNQAPGESCNGELLNEDQVRSRQDVPRVAAFVGYPTIHKSALGHEIGHAYRAWFRLPDDGDHASWEPDFKAAHERWMRGPE